MKRILLFSLVIFLGSCGDKNNTSSSDSAKGDTAADGAVFTADSAASWRQLTESWNASLNLRNASIMRSFYADSVLYYGDHLTADEVVHRQQEYFRINTDYKQTIEEHVDVIQQPDGNWLVKIIKKVTAGGKTANYPASLVYSKQNGIWKIVAESDDITDLNKARSLTAEYSPATTTVEGLVEENIALASSKEGDPKSNGKVPYYVIWAKHPLDLVPTSEQQASGMKPLKNVERIQLIGGEDKIRPLLNKKVRITGKILPATVGQHYTDVVLNVELAEEVP